MEKKSLNDDFIIMSKGKTRRPTVDELKRCRARRIIEDIEMLKSYGFSLEDIRGINE